jgi:hypothetical protein
MTMTTCCGLPSSLSVCLYSPARSQLAVGAMRGSMHLELAFYYPSDTPFVRPSIRPSLPVPAACRRLDWTCRTTRCQPASVRLGPRSAGSAAMHRVPDLADKVDSRPPRRRRGDDGCRRPSTAGDPVGHRPVRNLHSDGIAVTRLNGLARR